MRAITIGLIVLAIGFAPYLISSAFAASPVPVQGTAVADTPAVLDGQKTAVRTP